MRQAVKGGGKGCAGVIVALLVVFGLLVWVAVTALTAVKPATTATTAEQPTRTTSTAWEWERFAAGNQNQRHQIESKDPKQREAAFSSSLGWDTPTVEYRAAAVELLRKGLSDPDPTVRLAAAQRTIEKGLHRTTEKGFSIAEVQPTCEAMLSDAALRTRAATLLWTHFESASAAQVLAQVVADRKAPLEVRLAVARLTSRGEKPRRSEAVVDAMKAVFLDDTDTAPFRAEAGHLLNEEQIGLKAPDRVRTAVRAILDDPKQEGLVRAEALAFIIPRVKGGPPGTEARGHLVRLAGSADTPVPLRVRAFGLLDPQSKRFREEHANLFKLLGEALFDEGQDVGFRQFAANFYVCDSQENFAAALMTLAKRDKSTRSLRYTLAKSVHRRFGAGQSIPSEWLTGPQLQLIIESNIADFQWGDLSLHSADGHFHNDRPLGNGEPRDWVWDVEWMLAKCLLPRWAELLPQLCLKLDADYREAESTLESAPFHYSREWVILHEVVSSNPRRPSLHALASGCAGCGPAPLLDSAEAVETELIKLFSDMTQPESVRMGAMRVLTWNTFPEHLRRADFGSIYSSDPEESARLQLIGRFRTPSLQPRPTIRECCPHLLKGYLSKPVMLEKIAKQMARYGPDAKEAIPHLTAASKRHQADAAPYTSALAAIGPDSVPALGELMGEREPKLRLAAAEALGLIGPEGRSKATPILKAAASEDADPEVKKAALEALGQVNPAEAKKLGWAAR